MIERDQSKEQFKSRKLWSVISKSWEGTKVVNGTDNFSSSVRAVLTLCPLYTFGDLMESSLVKDPQSLNDSRVGSKWNGARAVINGMQNYIAQTDGDLSLTVVFADKGVISTNPLKENEAVLTEHEKLYQSVIGEELTKLGVDFRFFSYSQLGVQYPRFIASNTSVPEDLSSLSDEVATIEMIKRQLGLLNLCYGPEQQRLLLKLNEQWGAAFTAQMIASYMAFDSFFLSRLGNVYLSTERKGELHYLTGFNILGAEARMPRVLIPV